jgi:hypothetical protein
MSHYASSSGNGIARFMSNHCAISAEWPGIRNGSEAGVHKENRNEVIKTKMI